MRVEPVHLHSLAAVADNAEAAEATGFVVAYLGFQTQIGPTGPRL